MKSKKQKKEKRKKRTKEKHQEQDVGTRESSEDEMEWVEVSSSSQGERDPPSAERVQLEFSGETALSLKSDEWCESPFLTATTSLADIRKERDTRKEKEKEKDKNKSLSSFDNPGHSARELNPFWKNGGSGLPEERGHSWDQTAPVVRRVQRGVDGGVSWLKKAYQRAVEQAEDTGRSVDQVVAERWGSRAEYERLLAEAEAVCGGSSQSRCRELRGPSGPPPAPRWKKSRDNAGDTEERRDSDRDRRHADEQYHSKKYDHRKEGNFQSGDRDRTYGSDSRRDNFQRNFMRPGHKDRHSQEERSGICSKFRKPRDDESNDSNRRGSDTTFHDSRSVSRERLRDNDLPSWRKTGFKKPGEDGDSSLRSTSLAASSSRQVPPPPISCGSWRKLGFKKLREDGAESSSASSSRSWRKSEVKNMGKGEKGSKIQLSSTPSTSRQMSSSRATAEPKNDGDDSGDNSDDVRSSASSSPDTKRNKKGMEQEREKSPIEILSDTEMNQLGAKLIKAEIMGNLAQVQKLKAQIESSRQVRIAHKAKQLKVKDIERAQKREREEKSTEEVILTRTDHSGQSWPLDERTVPSDGGKKKRKKNIVTHDKDGERERYFADDDDVDLEALVRREKMGSADDHNRLLNKVASKKLQLLDSEFNTLDEMFVSSAAKGESRSRVEERERAKAIAEHRRTAATLSSCPLCLESGQMKKHLIVALGLKAYLCVPETRCMSVGQCYIVPMSHMVSSTALDEDVWAEIQVFRKGLTRMFEDHEMDAIFLETCMNPKKQRHMCIECIPVPRELGELGPIYFKKAIQESESEWSQNKKLVDTRKKGIRNSVPRGFPFFSVDFGLDGGFAHVIEDERVFPHYFGKEVIGGMLDVEPRLWRHPPKQNFEDQSKRVLQLSQWWKPFDWTQQIDREKS